MAARQTTTARTSTGVTDMHHMSGKVKKHESSKTNMDSCLKFSAFRRVNIAAQLEESYRLAVRRHNDERVTYETKKPTHDVRTIAEVEGGVVKAGKEVEWKEQIIVPPLPQSSLAGCELIKIEYYVKVNLKSPEVQLTLPIHIGNVSLDKKLHPSKKAAPPSTEDAPASTSTPDTSVPASMPTLPPRPGPKPAPRPAPRSRVSSHHSPSAPPAEYHPGAEGGTPVNDDFPNKRQSQLVSPNAFSYAPGLFFSPGQSPSGPAAVPSGPPFGGSAGATAPYPPVNGASPMPTTLSVPPNYSTSAYPQEAPPSYDESCNT